MTCFKDMTKAERENLLAQLENELASFKARDLKLNMARGKPSAEQLDLSMPLLEALTSYEDCISEDGTDCRNYGVLDGLPEAKRLMACMLDDEPENVIVFGNSSLTVMYDTLARCIDFGTGGCAPWANCGAIKWICPTPGYDRHFSVTEAFGIEMTASSPKTNRPRACGAVPTTPIRAASPTRTSWYAVSPTWKRLRRTSASSGTTRIACIISSTT